MSSQSSVAIALRVPVAIGVSMVVPPCPIRRLIALIQFVEVLEPAVVLLGPPSVGTIFALVPLVIVVAFAIVIPCFVSPALVSLRSLAVLSGLPALRTLGPLWLRLRLLYRSAFLSTLVCTGAVALLCWLIFLCSLVLSLSGLTFLRGTFILCEQRNRRQ